ncbi:MAG TPA: hypothetical protein VFB66_25575 [Tepidisphaeraceae bacterium]|nr:hypothetical protein [Tepidisphaeraceae bacterium]
MRPLTLSLLALALALPCGAADKPAAKSDASTSPTKRKADTPVAAMRAMMLDGEANDPKLLRPWIWTANDLEAEAADVWARSMTGQQRLKKAVYERFGAEGLERMDFGSKNPRPPRTDRAKAETELDAVLKDAVVKVDGDKATVTHPKQPGEAVELRKTDEGWKVTFASTLRESRPERLKEYIRLNKRWGPSFHDTAEEVAAGKFESVEEVNQSLTVRLHPEDAALYKGAAKARKPEQRR